MSSLRNFFLSFMLILNGTAAFAIGQPQLDSLRDMELRLQTLGEYQLNSLDEAVRVRSCVEFIAHFKTALKIENSFDYPFDSLKSISIQYPKDKSFRIFTWMLPFDNGTYRYYGAIQKKTKDGSLSLYPLFDASDKHPKATDSTLNADNWYGCLYYSLIDVKYKKKHYYTLLGWDGATPASNKKVMDVLWFDSKGRPMFGKAIFSIRQGRRSQQRVIFEFSNKASMLLRYEPKEKILVVENLIPPSPEQKGMFETYLPDGSYDYLRFKKGKWVRQKEQLFEKVRVGED